MTNYNNGKIYSIRSRSRPDLIYIGSTTQALSKRLGKHKNEMRCSSKQIILLGDAYIELIENYPCLNVEELRRREGEIQRLTDCVNRYIAGRTRPEYYKENTNKVKEQNKEYYHDHRERVLTQKKIYTSKHKEEKKRYDQTKKEKRICLCCTEYNYGNTNDRHKHYRSKKHQNHIQLIHQKLGLR